MTTSLVIVAILWTMVAATGARLAVGAHSGTAVSPYGFLAALFGAIALSLNLDPLYVALDDVLGERNLVDLAKHTALVLCAFFLAKATLAMIGALNIRRERWLLSTMCAVLVIQAVAFAAIDAQPTTTTFMATFGDRVPTLIYSLAHFSYFGFAEATAIAAALHFAAGGSWIRRTAALGFGVAGVAALLNLLVIATRDVLRLTGGTGGIDALDDVYKALVLAIAIGNLLGLGLPALLGAVRRRKGPSDRKSLSRAIDVISSAFERLDAETRDRFRVSTADAIDREAWHLSRIVVNLRDGQAVHAIHLTAAEETALQAVERHLATA